MSSYSEGQTHQLMNALEVAGFSAADITSLGQFDNLSGILDVLHGRSEIVAKHVHIIDCDAHPMTPDGWVFVEHIKGGQFEFDPRKVVLYLDEEQKEGGRIIGNVLREKLKGRAVYNANLLDFFLAYPILIPKEWKGNEIFFWGTIYRCPSDYPSGELCVRSLVWRGSSWGWKCRNLEHHFYSNSPTAIPASS